MLQRLDPITEYIRNLCVRSIRANSSVKRNVEVKVILFREREIDIDFTVNGPRPIDTTASQKTA